MHGICVVFTLLGSVAALVGAIIALLKQDVQLSKGYTGLLVATMGSIIT